MIKEIALFAGSLQMNIIYTAIFGFMRVIIPFIVRWLQYGNPFHSFGWDSWIYTSLEFLQSCIIICLNQLFLFAGLIDFKRRSIMLKACGVLIDPIKHNYPVLYRIFPTVNIACAKSIHTWFKLRQCLMSLGQKYLSRIFFYSSTFLGLYLIYVAILLLIFFEVAELNLSPYTYSIALYDITIALGTIMGMLIYGAIINEQYNKDQIQLEQMKESLQFINLNMDIVLNTEYDIPDEEYSFNRSVP